MSEPSLFRNNAVPGTEGAAPDCNNAVPGTEGGGVAVRAEGLRKGYGAGERRVEVLRGLDLEVAEGELLAVVGPSGVGKSTLLHLLGLLDRPDGGRIELFGDDVTAWTVEQRARFRNRSLGFVFQFHALLPEFTLAENVAMPLLIGGHRRAAALAAASELLATVGLAARADHFADQLSGGEQQRGAVARALVGSPRLLLADEPTGNLDAANAEALFELVRALHLSKRLTSVIVTHNEALAGRCDRVLRLAGANGG
jgi:lipoprotein-releasing system ATP-binding protein